MKKIFYYSPYFTPDNNAGVVRNNIFIHTLKDHFQINLLTGTKKAKCNHLFFTNPKNTDRFIIRLLKELLSGFELFFRILFSNKDLYFFSSPNYFTIFIGALACILKRQKYILDIRDIYPEVFFDAKVISRENILSKLLIRYTQFVYNHSSLITSVTNGLVKKIKDQTSTNVILIRNGYDELLFKPSTDKFEQFSCVFHGTFGAFQDIELLKSIIDKLETKDPSIHFHVIGKGPKENIINNLKNKNMTFHGALEYKDIPQIISKCHIGLSFRIDNEITKDSFPVKVYEYIGSSLPIISTPKNCEAGEFIERFNLGSNFNSHDIDELVDQIIEFKNNKSIFDELKNNCESHKDKFTRKSQANLLLEHILKL